VHTLFQTVAISVYTIQYVAISVYTIPIIMIHDYLTLTLVMFFSDWNRRAGQSQRGDNT